MLKDYADKPSTPSKYARNLGDNAGRGLGENTPRSTVWRIVRRTLLVVILLLISAFIALQVLGWVVSRRPIGPAVETSAGPTRPEAPEVRIKKLKTANDGISRKLAALAPQGTYVVIDTANNRVYMKNGPQTVREMVASCGSGNVLEDPVGGRKWTFETPRGEFKVNSKIANPVWIKPDWAFIEEGEPIPSNFSDRAKPGEMGDYAVGIGHGYFIHGTLYKRLLGRNVSHGCVRLGDEDLKLLYDTAEKGMRVIIY